MSLLEVHNVSQHFGELAAVRNVSLNVEEGELHAIIGPNGAGKTTFFNMISGFYRPTKGRIVFECPGLEALLVAHKALEELTLTKAQNEFKPGVARRPLCLRVSVASVRA